MLNYYQTDLIKCLAIFYLLINVSELKIIFTCNEDNFINKYKIIHYFITFFCFYLIVSLFTDTKELQNTPPLQKFLYSLGYFILFIMTTRLDSRIRILVIMGIFIFYYIEINKEFYLNKKNHDNNYLIIINKPFYLRLGKINKDIFIKINTFLEIFYYIIILLIFFGFIVYRGELKYHYKNNYSILTDILKTNVCKSYNKKLSMLEYFKLGLTI
jgi:hypothetical protein